MYVKIQTSNTSAVKHAHMSEETDQLITSWAAALSANTPATANMRHNRLHCKYSVSGLLLVPMELHIRTQSQSVRPSTGYDCKF